MLHPCRTMPPRGCREACQCRPFPGSEVGRGEEVRQSISYAIAAVDSALAEYSIMLSARGAQEFFQPVTFCARRPACQYAQPMTGAHSAFTITTEQKGKRLPTPPICNSCTERVLLRINLCETHSSSVLDLVPSPVPPLGSFHVGMTCIL